MKLTMPIRIALHALVLHATRSLLTTLGIAIGVSAVIAMVAIGEGAKAKMGAAFDSLGTNMLIVTSGSSRGGGAFGGAGSLPTLTWDDLRAIREEAPAVRRASPLMAAALQLTSVDTNWGTAVQGVSPEYFAIRNWPVRQGSVFSQEDEETGAKVVLLGQTVVDKLFGGSANVVGETVRIKNAPFLIAGVLAAKGQSGMGQDQDDCAYVPARAFLTKLKGTSLQNLIPGVIFVQAASAAAAVPAERQITALLRDRHHVDNPDGDDFAVANLEQIMKSAEDSLSTVTTLLGAVAAVSLLVGGIGIMNIMLVSVSERTKEIGLRMAIGAKPYDILEQFLIEAVTLALIGGLIGIAVGVGGAVALAAAFGWKLVLQPVIILVSVGFSAAVGIGFGLYPAQKASRLDPIVAMRSE
jgi:putative ABC transport system permease protein